MTYDAERALELLRKGTGQDDAEFRESQEDAIRHVVEGRGRLLVVQKTGWGKSFVYFIAAKLLREAGRGPALLFSPLLSLMRNQIAAAERMGIRADRITSDNTENWPDVEERLLKHDDVDILLVSPERLANQHFKTDVLAEIAERVALLVIDEAHCISDWGHDFRPHYRLIERTARTLLKNVRLLATTATANDRVMDDLRNELDSNLTVMRGDLNRPSLVLQTIRLSQQEERLAWLAERIPGLPGYGIIYALTVPDANRVADWLKSRGVAVEAYTAQTGDRREELEQLLLENRVKALVATAALGMGFDKPDLGFVIHYQSPASVVTYYQQVGRAGRALDAAYGVLLSGEEETRITDHFIDSAFPTREEVQQINEALEVAPDGLTDADLLGRINIRTGRLKGICTLISLELPAPIEKLGDRWQLTGADLNEEFWERADRVTELRKREQRQMRDYVGLHSGHMEFLIRALDDDSPSAQPPNLPSLPAGVTPDLVRESVDFLRRTGVTIDPRKQWPPDDLPEHELKGRIPEDRQAEPGKALCVWRDAGWGDLVRRGKYEHNWFADELVGACCKSVEQWSPQPEPQWVTCIPSLRRPELVPNFAERLAAQMGLPFRPVLKRTKESPEQKSMLNSTHQVRNVYGSLAVSEADMLDGPVLLVDDVVDSRWTLTIAAWNLRSHGSGEVWPLALAFARKSIAGKN